MQHEARINGGRLSDLLGEHWPCRATPSVRAEQRSPIGSLPPRLRLGLLLTRRSRLLLWHLLVSLMWLTRPM